jgi:hypothetical protein
LLLEIKARIGALLPTIHHWDLPHQAGKYGGRVNKIIGWYKCEYPGCPVETDTSYELQYQRKKILVCEGCLRKIRRRGKGGVSESVHVACCNSLLDE